VKSINYLGLNIVLLAGNHLNLIYGLVYRRIMLDFPLILIHDGIFYLQVIYDDNPLLEILAT
jgi:hypothetical protein